MADATTIVNPVPTPAGVTLANPQIGANASLYVGDLHPDVTEAVLFDLFGKVGQVVVTRVCRDSVTRRSLGYAYVNYALAEDAAKAIELLNFEPIKGQPCRIMFSQRDPSLRRSNANNIFIKNIDKALTNKMIYDTFSTFGTILSCKIKVDDQGKSLGYGFVHFKEAEAAQKAIAEVNGKAVDGYAQTPLYVGPFVSQRERMDQAGRSGARFTNVFFKNLPGGYSAELLTALCAPYGTITSAAVMAKVINGETRAMGFCAFKEHEMAVAAVAALNKHVEGGNEIFADRAQSKAERQALLRRLTETKRAEHVQASKGVNLFIKNLDVSIDDKRLSAYFSEFGTITSAKVMLAENGVSKGFGFVCFSEPQEATKAQIELNKRVIDGKPLYVALAQRKEDRQRELSANAHARARGGFPGVMGFPLMHPQMQMQMMQMNPALFGQRFPPQAFGGPRRNFPSGAQYGQPGFVPRLPGQGPQGQFAPQQGPPQSVRGAGPRTGGVPPQAGGAPQQQQQQQQQQQLRGPAGQSGVPAQQARGAPRSGAPQGAYRSAAQGGRAPAATEPVQLLQPGLEPLTLADLASKSEPEQKQILGERLYPAIEVLQGANAGKITGMLLEMDVGELFHLLEDNAALASKVTEAVRVLEDNA